MIICVSELVISFLILLANEGARNNVCPMIELPIYTCIANDRTKTGLQDRYSNLKQLGVPVLNIL